MDRNIESYIKVYNNFLSKEECNIAVKELNSITDYHTHSYYQQNENKSYSFDTDFLYSYSNISLKEKITINIWFKIKEYIDDLNFVWMSAWSGYTDPRFNRYDVGTCMNEHCDNITSIFDGTIKGVPMLSVLGLLNDDYEGGEFVMWRDKVIELKAGDLIIFPSNFLYPHKVNPVTKGTRYSYISWVY